MYNCGKFVVKESSMNKEKLIRKFDNQSRLYEMRRKKRSEQKWREKLIGNARGEVLEVAVGAGANFHYYPEDVHVTAVDFSNAMLSKAKESAVDNGVGHISCNPILNPFRFLKIHSIPSSRHYLFAVTIILLEC
jgi:ubiquinone/menaquinone biosynthesis C-methylase UbiE